MASTGSRGGKHPKVTVSGYYYNKNDAGTRHEKGSPGMPTRRKFVGSGIQRFTFRNTAHGTHTIPAHSFAEALRIAKSMGFTREDYIKR